MVTRLPGRLNMGVALPDDGLSAWAVPPVPLGSAAVSSAQPGRRSVALTPASTIKARPVRWLWADRIALGSLALLGGREGIGKSTVGYTLAADVTRGRMPGQHHGTPRAVIVAATEDSWEHTIVPRLMAADADLELVFRVDVTTSDNVDTALSLPNDLLALERSIAAVGAALILLDPLMSRLDASLDTHKDAEVRQALEPLVAVAGRSGAAILGLIHVNKAHSTDPLTILMGSRAFAAVARSVLFVITDPEDEGVRLLGQPKNNLGSTDMPTLTFRIDSAHVADTDEGPIWTGRITWLDDRQQSIRDALEAAADTLDGQSAVSEAADWLEDYLTSQGGTADAGEAKAAGQKQGHSKNSIQKARKLLGGTSQRAGFPRRAQWSLPVDPPSGESSPNRSTGPTGSIGLPVGPVDPIDPVKPHPPRAQSYSADRDPPQHPQLCRTCGKVTQDRDPGGRPQHTHCQQATP